MRNRRLRQTAGGARICDDTVRGTGRQSWRRAGRDKITSADTSAANNTDTSAAFDKARRMRYTNSCLVMMAEGTHPFPSRTRRLSPPAPMVLGPQGPGRVGRCQASELSHPAGVFVVSRSGWPALRRGCAGAGRRKRQSRRKREAQGRAHTGAGERQPARGSCGAAVPFAILLHNGEAGQEYRPSARQRARSALTAAARARARRGRERGSEGCAGDRAGGAR